MTALRRHERIACTALVSVAIAASCAKAEDSPLADRGGTDDDGGDSRGGKGGTAGAAGATSTGGSAGGGGTATGGTAGKGGTTSTGGKGGTTSSGGSGGSSTMTYGCLAGEGGASGGAPGEAGAGGAGPSTLFTDDFEDEDAMGWIPTSGSWAVVADDSNAYEQSVDDQTAQYISAVTDTCWADQIVEARVKVVSFNGNSTTNTAGLFARYVSAQTHYMIGMNSGSNGELFIGKRVQSTSNSPERIARENDMDWEEGRWYTLRLEVVGSSLKAYVDDVLVVETTDAQITSGGVAVGARHAHVRFDDVRVTQP
jgi:hypothetical protein